MTIISYGTIVAYNDFERVFSLLIMITGGLLMTYSISVLGQIIYSMDEGNAAFEAKVQVLDRIHEQYYLPLDLYVRLKQSLRYRYSKNIDDLNEFIDELPEKLKVETAIMIHEETWRSIECFKNESDFFIAWICPKLRPLLVLEDSEVFHENERIESLFFLKSGVCGYVLSARFNYLKYIDFYDGCFFGVVDMVGSIMNSHRAVCPENALEDWVQYQDCLYRQFNVSAQNNCELLTLPI